MIMNRHTLHVNTEYERQLINTISIAQSPKPTQHTIYQHSGPSILSSQYDVSTMRVTQDTYTEIQNGHG